MENKFNAENILKKTLTAKDKLQKGGEGALEAHHELNQIAEEADKYLYDEAREEYKKHTSELDGSNSEHQLEKENSFEFQRELDIIINLLENSNDLKFMAGGRGNISKNGAKNGFHVVSYDSNNSGMKLEEDEIIGGQMDKRHRTYPEQESWETEYYGYKDEGKVFIKKIVHFMTRIDTNFLIDPRRQHFVTALVCDKDKFKSLDNDIKKILGNPPGGADEFLGRLFDIYAEKTIPDYYHYVLSCVDATKKLIASQKNPE